MSGCGHSECFGHGHYEICGQPGQLGIYECDGCKVKGLEADVKRLDKQIESLQQKVHLCAGYDALVAENTVMRKALKRMLAVVEAAEELAEQAETWAEDAGGYAPAWFDVEAALAALEDETSDRPADPKSAPG